MEYWSDGFCASQHSTTPILHHSNPVIVPSSLTRIFMA
jgi:hypothetical protein